MHKKNYEGNSIDVQNMIRCQTTRVRSEWFLNVQ